MPLRRLLPDVKGIQGGEGNGSKRTCNIRLPCYWTGSSRRAAVVDDVCQASGCEEVSHNQGSWASLPVELLRNILQRVEAADSSWPARKNVVACSAVCRAWRAITKDLVKTSDESAKLTFPLSLKQPGPRERFMQCFIKRDKSTSTFFLYLGLSPTTLLVENCKFLLAAHKVRRVSSIEYIVSLNLDDPSTGTGAFVGKVRSNFLGTKFKVLDTHPPCDGAPMWRSNRSSCRRRGARQVCPKAPLVIYEAARVAYRLNVVGARGPRRMLCTLNPVRTLSSELSRDAPSSSTVEVSYDYPFYRSPDARAHSPCERTCSPRWKKKCPPLILKNKAPRWHEQLQCWCLNFRGRVTVASVKNFQLVAAMEEPGSSSPKPQNEQDKVLLQFGKIGKDIFTMDYRHPLSAYQAFAICLTSFGTKLACE